MDIVRRVKVSKLFPCTNKLRKEVVSPLPHHPRWLLLQMAPISKNKFPQGWEWLLQWGAGKIIIFALDSVYY